MSTTSKWRSGLRKHQQPLEVYELSTSSQNKLSARTIRYVLVGLAALLAIAAGIFWSLNRARSPQAIATTVPKVETVAGTSKSAGGGPGLTAVAYWGITSSGITMSWSTNIPSTTSVAYGTTPDLGSVTPEQTKLANSHTVQITGLQPGQKYYFVAQSADANKVVGHSVTYTFTTLSNSPPIISDIKVVPQPGHKAQISWTTSVSAYSYVKFGSTSSYGKWSLKTNLTANPSPALGWVPAGTVHYQIHSVDASGNEAVSPDYTFEEPTDQTSVDSAPVGVLAALRTKLHVLKHLL